jgi:addiction module HigA family antidote
MKTRKIQPIHPGEILMEEFLPQLELSQNQLANEIGVPPRRINEIVHGKRRITADTALRLAHYFKMSPQFWLGLQMDYDLDIEEDKLAARLKKEVTIYEPIHKSA